MTSRAQFEAWHQTQIATLVRCGAIDRAREFEAMKPTLELVWEESRAAVVVGLPPPYPMPEEPEFADDDSYMDAYHAAKGMRHACGKAIEAAGLKVTP